MKSAYLMTYAFLGLLTLSFLMVTLVKAMKHINFEEPKEPVPVIPMEQNKSPEEAPQP